MFYRPRTRSRPGWAIGSFAGWMAWRSGDGGGVPDNDRKRSGGVFAGYGKIVWKMASLPRAREAIIEKGSCRDLLEFATGVAIHRSSAGSRQAWRSNRLPGDFSRK